MSLSDLMSSFGLSVFAEIGLIAFFLIFLAVVARAALAPAREMRRAARLVLADDTPTGQTPVPPSGVDPTRPEPARPRAGRLTSSAPDRGRPGSGVCAAGRSRTGEEAPR